MSGNPRTGRPDVLRPVGEPVSRKFLSSKEPMPVPDGYVPLFLDSGTSALALAIGAVRSHSPIEDPAIVLPGYGCPDLVSAAVFAGVEIRVADTEPGTPFISARTVEHVLDDRTIAVVAAHSLGIMQPLDDIDAVCRGADCMLIEDSAQSFPRESYGQPVGDLVVHSFGRGKPGGALGGGALFVRNELAEHIADRDRFGIADHGPTLLARLGLLLHRVMLKSGPYGVVESAPFLHVGETRYRELTRIAPLEAGRQAVALAGVRQWRSIGSRAGFAVRNAVDGVEGFSDLLARFPGTDPTSLLRYPLLADTPGLADDAVREMRGQGIGASRFYGKALPDLDDLPDKLRDEVPNAADFAARLLTLPVHSDVSAESCIAIRRALDAARALGPREKQRVTRIPTP